MNFLSLSLEDVDMYLAYLSTEKGLSFNTIQAYQTDLLCFVREFASSKTLSPLEIKKYLKKQKTRYSPSSVIRKVAVLRGFFVYLMEEKNINLQLSNILIAPKLPKYLPTFLTQEEMKVLLKRIPTMQKWPYRALAIIETLYATGIRVSELCQISVPCVKKKCIRVLGKGGKERLVPLGEVAAKSIDDYIVHERVCLSKKRLGESFLFLSDRGNPLNRTAIWKIVKDVMSFCRISKPISPHTFRHTFATHLLENGADLRVIQEYLGHVDIGTTEIYTHVCSEKLKHLFKKFHPAEKTA